jgi:hypothetical protein
MSRFSQDAEHVDFKQRTVQGECQPPEDEEMGRVQATELRR